MQHDENAAELGREDQNQDDSFEASFNEFSATETDDSSSATDNGNDNDNGNDVDAGDVDGAGNAPVDELEELKRRNEELLRERNHFEHSFKSQAGRVSALQKKLDSLPVAPEVDADLQEVMQDYPEIAKPIVDYFEKKYGDINNRIAPIQQSAEESEQRQYIQGQLAIMDKEIPDWHAIVTSDEYLGWLEQQPEAVRSMRGSNDAVDYKFLIKSFQGANPSKAKSDDLTTRRQNKLAANVSVQSKGASKTATAPDDFEAAWNFYAQKKGS